MIRGFGADNERFLLNLERIQNRAANAQRQMTSGYRVEKLSDAPPDINEILVLQAQIASSTQSINNLAAAQSEVDANEATLRQAVKILDDVMIAGAQGANHTATTEQRNLLAQRVRDFQETLVQMANQERNGRYQFGGDRDDIAPYSVGWGQPGGIVRAHNQPDTRLIEDAAGNRFSISRRAQDIFDVRDGVDGFAPGNVFNAVYTLSEALAADDPEATMDAVEMVKTAAVHLNNELATYGHAQNRVEEASEQAKQIQLRATTELAGVREVDLPEAILELSQANANLQAALGAQGQVSRVSLFDYLG